MRDDVERAAVTVPGRVDPEAAGRVTKAGSLAAALARFEALCDVVWGRCANAKGDDLWMLAGAILGPALQGKGVAEPIFGLRLRRLVGRDAIECWADANEGQPTQRIGDAMRREAECRLWQSFEDHVLGGGARIRVAFDDFHADLPWTDATPVGTLADRVAYPGEVALRVGPVVERLTDATWRTMLAVVEANRGPIRLGGFVEGFRPAVRLVDRNGNTERVTIGGHPVIDVILGS